MNTRTRRAAIAASQPKAPNALNRVRRLQQDASQLADWYRRFRPENRVIRLTEPDYKLLVSNTAIARQHGFSRLGASLTFGEFQILPADAIQPGESR